MPAKSPAGQVAISPHAVAARLAEARYLADEGLATAIFLAIRLGKPLLLEGAPGVGKTEAAKVIAEMVGAQLVRLQCYEGIDSAHALYEWNYQRQLLAIRQAGDQEVDIYDDRFLIARPLLQVLKDPEKRVLLVDEIDRSDHEFEALLLEFLSDFQITIPERGTLRAKARPVVVLTSNRTRELAEALRRRCVYHWIGYPDAEREAAIIMLRAAHVAEATARGVARAVQQIRARPLAKPPGISEAVEWANAATLLEKGGSPWPEAFRRAISVLIKDEEDLSYLAAEFDPIIAKALA
jgi:MoxR-like ATPase